MALKLKSQAIAIILVSTIVKIPMLTKVNDMGFWRVDVEALFLLGTYYILSTNRVFCGISCDINIG